MVVELAPASEGCLARVLAPRWAQEWAEVRAIAWAEPGVVVLALGWELASAQPLEQALAEESVEALAASRARGWALPMAAA